MKDEIKVTVVEFGDRSCYQLQYRDPITGRKKTKSSGVERDGSKKARTAAEREAAKWEDELRSGRYVPPSRMTWESFRERYEAEKLPSLAPRTAERASAVFNKVEAILNPQRLSQLTADRLSYFQSKLREDGQREATIAGTLAYLRAALNWAKSVKLLHQVPDVAMPKRAKGSKIMKGRPITLEEFERMMDAVPAIREHDAAAWKRLLWGLWYSGLRLSEALMLSWDAEGELMVDLRGKHPRLRIWAAAEKGNQDRLLPITPDFAQWLLETAKEERKGPVMPVHGQWADQPMSVKRVSKIISAIGKKAGVIVSKADGKYASAHDLRRAFGTRWAGKVKPATLRLLMRHESIETTLKYYVEQDADEVAAELWATVATGNTSGNTAQAGGNATSNANAANPAPTNT